MVVDHLNQHTGLTPANIVMVDYRNPNEIRIHFLDPYAGLSTTIWNERTDAKFPDHFKFDNPHRVDFNFPLIAGFVQEGRSSDFCEVYVKGGTTEDPIKFDVQNIPIFNIGEMYEQYQGHIPKIYYMSIKGHQTVIVTPHKTDMLEFKRAIIELKTRAKRPDAAGPKGPGSDTPEHG